MEGDVERWKAAVLRGTVATQQDAHGEAPRLPIQVAFAFVHLTSSYLTYTTGPSGLMGSVRNYELCQTKESLVKRKVTELKPFVVLMVAASL